MEDIKIINNKGKKFIWISPLTAGLILTIMFKAAHRFPGENRLFLVKDYYIQFMEYIVMFWRKLLSGNGLFYSFDLGLGAPTWEHYSFYGFSPFNIVFLFIKDVDTAAFCLLLLKVCAIAVCMHIFLIYGMKVRTSIAILFSVPYALCAFVMCFYYCIVFMDYLSVLPLVMLFMIRFFRTGKVSGLTAMYAYSFLTGYYGGYMVGIFSFVCFVVMIVNGKYCETKIKLLVRYLGGVTVAVLISAVVTVPSAVAILSGMNGESSIVLSLNIHLQDIVAAMYPFVYIEIYSIVPAVYCGLLTLISVLCFFLDKKYKIKYKMAVALPIVFLIICTLFKPAHLMMHGFDEPDGYIFRFAFIFSFYLSSVGAKWMEERKEDVKILSFVFVVFFEFMLYVRKNLFLNIEAEETDIVIFAVVSVFALLYFLSIKKSKYIMMCGIAIIEMMMNGYYCLTHDDTFIYRWRESYDLVNKQGNQALSKISLLEEDSGEDQFYRINYRYGLYVNDGMYFGYHGLGYFSSMEQKDERKALKNLGYATSNRMVVEKGGSPYTEMIFAEKYRVMANSDIREPNCDNVDVELNRCTLPLAFAVSDRIMEYKTGANVFENQQKLLNAMLGEEICIWDMYAGDISTNNYNCDLVRMDDDRICIRRSDQGNALCTLSLKQDENDDYYSYIAIKENGIHDGAPQVLSDAESGKVGQIYYSTVSTSSMIRLGNNEGKSSLYIKLFKDGDDEVCFDRIFFANYRREGLEKAYAELKPGGMEISHMKDDDIYGYISIPSSKEILFTSIPYDRSWHIRVDGKEVETFSVIDGAFLACRLPEGEHEIRIYFDNRSIRIGAWMSLFGIILLMRVLISEKKQRVVMNTQSFEKEDE